MRIAIVGCGFVADLYMQTLRLYPQLEVAGGYDRDTQRLHEFASFHGIGTFDRLEDLLADDRVNIVLNLTNPRSHFEVSRACLEAGKHVYSEKPLAMDLGEAGQLVDLAESRGLQLAGAPATVLGETAQTIWRALREGRVGPVRCVYAEMEEGLIHRFPYRRWMSPSGRPWPWQDEFEVGCTLEHAGYCLTWLCAFFGPARRVVALSSQLVPDKQTDRQLNHDAPDFSVASIVFADGTVARMTCGIVAPHDHLFRVIGDEGVLYTPESWSNRSPVYLRKWTTIRRRGLLSPWRKKLPLLGRKNPAPPSGGAQRIDFARGVADLAEAIEQNRTPRLNGRFALHVTELALAISNAGTTGVTHELTTSFDPMEPMPWAV